MARVALDGNYHPEYLGNLEGAAADLGIRVAHVHDGCVYLDVPAGAVEDWSETDVCITMIDANGHKKEYHCWVEA